MQKATSPFKFIILHKKAGLTEMFPHNDWNDMNAPSFLHCLWSTQNTSKLYLHCLSFYNCSNCHSEAQTQWDLMLSLHALRKFVLLKKNPKSSTCSELSHTFFSHLSFSSNHPTIHPSKEKEEEQKQGEEREM